MQGKLVSSWHMVLGPASAGVFVSFIFIFCGASAIARLAGPNDLPSVNEAETADVQVDANGHSVTTIDRMIRVNNDEGRERESVQTIDFNARSSKVKILLAETINGDQHMKVSADNIEFKAIGDFVHGFDTQTRAKITFPNVRVKSHIHFRYLITVSEVPNEGFYSFLADFNWWYIEHYQAKIRSVLPLHYWKQDPQKVLSIRQGKDGDQYLLDIQSTAPISLTTVQEENPYIRAERSTAFGVSSLSDWSQYAQKTIVSQESLFAEKLPSSLEKIRAAADRETTPLAKLDRVHALVAEEFRYFGDWRRRNGGYVPRSLSEIDRTHYGDCKDLSLVVTAIYRSLGFKADLAWTVRGEPHLKPAHEWFQIPTDWFNHAVTRVEVDGVTYWIDATNPVANSKQIPQDISEKPAFVMNREKSYLQFTPGLGSTTATYNRSLVYSYQSDETLRVSGELTLKGRAAIPLTVARFYKPIDTLKYDLVRASSFGYRILNSWVGDLPATSRIVGDMQVKLGYTLNDVGVRTSSGIGFFLPRENMVDRLLEDVKGRNSDIYAGETPGVWNSREQLMNLKLVGDSNLDCEIHSRWASASRQVRQIEGSVVANDRIELFTNVVPIDEAATPEFTDFQNRLRACFFRETLVLQPTVGATGKATLQSTKLLPPPP